MELRCPGFIETKTNCRIAHSLGILLMNRNCCAFYFQQYFNSLFRYLFFEDLVPRHLETFNSYLDFNFIIF